MFSHVIVSRYNSDQDQMPKAIDFVTDVSGGGGGVISFSYEFWSFQSLSDVCESCSERSEHNKECELL